MTACELDASMFSVASEVLKDNGFGRDHWRQPVRLLPIHSDDIVVQSDSSAVVSRTRGGDSDSDFADGACDVEMENLVAKRFDLVVTETLDCCVFGEGIVSSLYGAWTKLLRSQEVVEEEIDNIKYEQPRSKKVKNNEIDSKDRKEEEKNEKFISHPRMEKVKKDEEGEEEVRKDGTVLNREGDLEWVGSYKTCSGRTRSSVPRVIPAAVKIFIRGFESPSFRRKILSRYNSVSGSGVGIVEPLTFLAKNTVVGSFQMMRTQ